MSDTLLLDEETCWRAVENRDASFSGRFVLGVRSTKIYCRPGCPARLPKRQNVTFFAACAQAEAAGYRACKRCQPNRPLEPQAQLVTDACRLLEESSRLPLAELGRRLGVSPWHLQRVFKAATGLSPRQYAAARREQQLKEQLRQGQDVAGALYAAGYGSHSRLYETAGQRLGMTPGQLRRGGKGMTIYYAIVACRLGRMLVAATSRGVCALSFGQDDADLEAFLRREYPSAALQANSQYLAAWLNDLLAYLDGQQPRLDLPLDVQATAFQLRVWEELRRIPYGQTRTYTQVAQAIGQPSAVRAVARACAANPAAVITPCHRVVRSDGSLAGYRWGTQRKQALLDMERQAAEQQTGELAQEAANWP